jgi:hypothetical protein
VFDRPRAAAHWDPTRPLVVSSLELVDLDDDEAWMTVCPVRHRWWDVDLYPDLAATRGIVGLTTSTEFGDRPAAPGGVVVHTGRIEIG